MTTQEKLQIAAIAAELRASNNRLDSGHSIRAIDRSAPTRRERLPIDGRYSFVAPRGGK